MQSEKCEHNPNVDSTSIFIDQNKKIMTFPVKYFGICLKCGKSFEYIKDNGKYKEL